MKQGYGWIGILLIFAVSAAGCSTRQMATTLGLGAAAGAGVAAVYYVKGDLAVDQDDDIYRVHRAALSTMERRGYRVTTNDVNETAGHIEAVIPARGEDDEQKVTIKLERKEENLTNLSIRIGIFGDEALSRAILDDIQSRIR